MDASRIKSQSEHLLRSWGVSINPALPPLEELTVIRSLREVEDRSLGLYAAVAASFNAPREKVLSWLRSESLLSALSGAEREFLEPGGQGEPSRFQCQEEALAALAWSLQLIGELPPLSHCPQSLSELFPTHSGSRTVSAYRSNCALRDIDAIAPMIDVLYRLDSAMLNPQGVGSLPIQPYVVRERRRALEWLCSQEEWDWISLDT